MFIAQCPNVLIEKLSLVKQGVRVLLVGTLTGA